MREASEFDPLLIELLRLMRYWFPGADEAGMKAWLSTAPRKPRPRRLGAPTVRIRNNITGKLHDA